MIRERIAEDLKDAIRARESERVAALRLMLAAIKDREIADRQDTQGEVPDSVVMSILEKMIKQRRESASVYEEAGRLDLAKQEQDEIRIIQRYLPKQLNDQEVQKAIQSAIQDTGANSVRDMGRVMAMLKSQHAGKMDFAKAGAMVKESFR